MIKMRKCLGEERECVANVKGNKREKRMEVLNGDMKLTWRKKILNHTLHTYSSV